MKVAIKAQSDSVDLFGSQDPDNSLSNYHFQLLKTVRAGRGGYNSIVVNEQVEVGNIVRMRKKHPCGSDLWQISRTGVDIGLICLGCQRRIMIPRSRFIRSVKSIGGQSLDGNPGSSTT